MAVSVATFCVKVAHCLQASLLDYSFLRHSHLDKAFALARILWANIDSVTLHWTVPASYDNSHLHGYLQSRDTLQKVDGRLANLVPFRLPIKCGAVYLAQET